MKMDEMGTIGRVFAVGCFHSNMKEAQQQTGSNTAEFFLTNSRTAAEAGDHTACSLGYSTIQIWRYVYPSGISPWEMTFIKKNGKVLFRYFSSYFRAVFPSGRLQPSVTLVRLCR